MSLLEPTIGPALNDMFQYRPISAIHLSDGHLRLAPSQTRSNVSDFIICEFSFPSALATLIDHIFSVRFLVALIDVKRVATSWIVACMIAVWCWPVSTSNEESHAVRTSFLSTALSFVLELPVAVIVQASYPKPTSAWMRAFANLLPESILHRASGHGRRVH